MTLEGNWTCSVCGRHVTLGRADVESSVEKFYTLTGRADSEGFVLGYELRRCPNKECKSSDLSVSVYHAVINEVVSGPPRVTGNVKSPAGVGRFQFLPTTVNPLSKSVPVVVADDYREAYLIRSLSPKASAAPARRALQGMIRDFHGVVRDTLHQEIEAIKEKCDSDLYEAMMAA